MSNRRSKMREGGFVIALKIFFSNLEKKERRRNTLPRSSFGCLIIFARKNSRGFGGRTDLNFPSRRFTHSIFHK